MSEDRPDEDVLPRVVAAGGERTGLAVVEIDSPKPGELPRSLDLARDASFFEAALERFRPALVVVDPLIGQIDTAFDADKAQHVRAFLRPLDATAARHDASLLGVVHMNRSASSDPMRRVSASKGVPGAGTLDAHPRTRPRRPDSDWRVLALDKSNLAADVQARAYRVERLDVDVDGHELGTARLRFLGFTEQTARDLLMPRVKENDGELERAKGFLRDLLEHGAAAANVGLQLAQREGLSERTLRRARAELGVTATPGGTLAGNSPRREHQRLEPARLEPAKS